MASNVDSLMDAKVAASSRPSMVVMLLFALPVLLCIYQWSRYPDGLGEGFEPANVARSLAEHGAFANPFAKVITGPTAHLAPAFPFFLSLLVRVFGYSLGFAFTVVVLGALMHGLHSLLLVRTSKLFFGTSAPGFYAAVLTVALPMVPFLPGWEAIYVADAWMIFCLLTASILTQRKQPILVGMGAGTLTGLLCLLNPVSLLVCFLWIVVLLISRGFGKRVVAMSLAAFIAAAMLVSLPWNLRNFHVFHHWIFIRDSLGFELYDSNNDLASPAEIRNRQRGLLRKWQLHFNPEEAAIMRNIGEVNYYNRRGALAVEWIRQHPGRFADLTAHRVVYFWFPAVIGWDVEAYSVWFVTLLSIPGLILIVRRRYSIAWFILCVLAAYPLLYYLVQSSHRFRIPIFWLTVLGAGYWIHDVVSHARGRRSRILHWVYELSGTV